MEPNQTSEILKQQLKRKQIDENTALELIFFNVENLKEESERVQYIELLSDLGIKNNRVYKFLEELVVSDLSGQVRASALEVITSLYKEEVTDLLKWVVKNETFPKNLIIAFEHLNYLDEFQLRDVLIRDLDEFINTEPSILAQEYCYDLRRFFKVNTYDKMPLDQIFEIFLNLKSILSLINSFNLKQVDYRQGIEYSLENGLITGLKLWGLGIRRLSEIGHLKYITNLEFLDVSETDLEVVDGLERYPKLKSLELGKNKISEIKGLNNLVNLEILDISNNKVKEIGGLYDLKKLKVLHLAFNQIEEINGLENLQDLETLILDHNLISELRIRGVLPHLEGLYLSNNQLKTLDLGNFPSLETLSVALNPLIEIKGLKELKKLDRIIVGYDQLLGIRGFEEQKGFTITLHVYRRNEVPWFFNVEEIEKYRNLILKDKEKKKI
ncbi:MAG: leucine-rich repeat domain-containing protein [Candidatus Lokiarchaeota archaeon]|nr:leucine-rich repeat domain-containing protein [Candidatus Lokiarchaeota archaeon]